MNIRTVIVDDEHNAIENLNIILNEYCSEIEVVGTASSVIEAVKVINSNQPDLLLLDIELPHGTGFDILDIVNKEHIETIFVTAYDQYAIRAIKQNVTDYIMKPVSISGVVQAIDKARKAIELKTNRKLEEINTKKGITVPTSNGIRTTNFEGIEALNAEGSYTIIHLSNGEKLVVSRKLKQFEDLMPNKNFIRVHHSIIVNTDLVLEFNKKDNCLKMKSGKTFEVSRRKKDEFIEKLKQNTHFV